MAKSSIDVAERLAQLSASTIFELRGEWRRLHRAPPPMRFSRYLLMRGITYKLQERSLGGLSKSMMRKLERLNLDSEASDVQKPPPISLKTGTRLVREWRGVTHTVLVHADGFEWNGRRHRSLTIVAPPAWARGEGEPVVIPTRFTEDVRAGFQDAEPTGLPPHSTHCCRHGLAEPEPPLTGLAPRCAGLWVVRASIPTPRTHGAQDHVDPFHREVPELQECCAQEGERRIERALAAHRLVRCGHRKQTTAVCCIEGRASRRRQNAGDS